MILDFGACGLNNLAAFVSEDVASTIVLTPPTALSPEQIVQDRQTMRLAREKRPFDDADDEDSVERR
jgi:hypothetical protein